MINSYCQFNDCDRPLRSMGLCAKHYTIFQRQIGNGKTCKDVSCDRPALAKSYCNKHYLQLSIKGDTSATKYDKRPAIIEDGYAKIPLNVDASKGYALVDIEYAWLDQYQWIKHHTGYVRGTIDGKDVGLQRIIMNAPENMTVDHINHDPLDNRRSNLRVCTQTENRRNARKTHRNTTGYKGVVASYGGKFTAKVGYFGKKLHVGTYATAEEAARAYDKKIKKLHGEFALTNFEN